MQRGTSQGKFGLRMMKGKFGKIFKSVRRVFWLSI